MDHPKLVLEYVPIEGEPVSWPFRKSLEEVETFSADTLRDIGHKRFFDGVDAVSPPVTRQADLHALATRSHAFLATALSEADLKAVEEILATLDGATLRVTTEGGFHSFPWTLLHPAPVPELNAMTCEGFLGWRLCLVFYDLRKTTSLGSDVLDDLIRSALANRAFGLIDDPALPSVQRKVERDYFSTNVVGRFRPLHDPTNHPPPNLASTADLAQYLTDQRWEVVHFACHGELKTDAVGACTYTFNVRRAHEVESRSLHAAVKQRAIAIGKNRGQVNARLLFLNMCASNVPGVRPSDPAEAMGSLSPAAVIGTLGAICDASAARLATLFYDRAIKDGHTVGQALLMATRESLLLTQNPTNLLFTISGNPHLVIA